MSKNFIDKKFSQAIEAEMYRHLKVYHTNQDFQPGEDCCADESWNVIRMLIGQWRAQVIQRGFL